MARMALLLAGLPGRGARRRRSTGCAARACRRSITRRARDPGRRGRRVRRRRRREHDPRAVVMPKPDTALPRGQRELLRHDARLALRQPEDGRAVPAAADGRDGRERGREVRASRARTRTRSRCAATSAAVAAQKRAASTTRSCRSRSRSEGRRARRRRRTSTRARTRRWRRSRSCEPAFREDGTVTAGNSSPLNDGAAGAAC